VQVEAYEGKDRLRKYLEALPFRPGFRDLISLGITRDADDDLNGAFSSICYYLSEYGRPVPEAPSVPAGSSPSVSVFIFPDCASSGMLEDLFLASTDDDPRQACLDRFFECIATTGTPGPKNRAKARVQAWLSTQEISDLRLGHSSAKGLWNWDHSTFNRIKKFLRQISELPTVHQ